MRITLSSSGDRLSREAVGTYLRTGILLPERPAAVEAKFNPYHDRLGRFTFGPGGGGSGDGGAASGSWGGGGFTGPGGGGRGFDGGGATNRDPWPDPPKRGSPAAPQKRAPGVVPPRPAAAAALVAGSGGVPWHSVERNGYTYQLDAKDRTRQVTGTLTLNGSQARSRSAQASAGGSDRLASDDGGHYVARRFNGPTDAFNHFAQDANFNRGEYRGLENEWAKDMRAGKIISVRISPEYEGASKRPSNIRVTYTINGLPKFRRFANGSKGRSHGK